MTMIGFSFFKFTALLTHYKFITITIYVIMFVVELSRLYLGYEGNLREKVYINNSVFNLCCVSMM